MQRHEPVLQTVILAAGTGTRLVDSRGDVPKPLMSVGGLPLVHHALNHALAAGCHEAVVVVGYEAARVRAEIEALRHPLRIRFAATPDPSLPNGVSLLASEPLAADRFFLQMVDHLFAAMTLGRLADGFLASEGGRVLVDRAPVGIDLEDATKVRLSGSQVTAIGKGIEPWDAIDAGCFVLTHAIFEALRHAPADEPRSVSSGMRQLVGQRLLGAVDVEGTRWMDVDTPADRQAAERWLSALQEERAAAMQL